MLLPWRRNLLEERHVPCKQEDVPGELVANHLDVDLLAHAEPEAADEALVNPRLELTHPA